MLKILKEAKKAYNEGYKYVGFNSKKEPEKVEALFKLCEKFDLFCGRGLSEKELLELKDENRFVGIDLRDTFELKTVKNLSYVLVGCLIKMKTSLLKYWNLKN